MPKQPAILSSWRAEKELTRREQVLAEMEVVVSWGRVLALIAPHDPRVGPTGGRPPMPLETMLRMSVLQNWYGHVRDKPRCHDGSNRSHGTPRLMYWSNC